MQKLHRVYRYALFLAGRFKYLLLAALVTFCVATTVFWFLHPDQHNPATRKNLGEVMFGVFELMFVSEPALPYPKGSVVSQVVYCALPVLNILGIAAAVAQFSQVLFDKSLYNVAQADHADRHVILCGLGRLGRVVLRQLDRRHGVKRRRDVVIVECGSGVDEVDTDLITREPIIPVVRGNMTHAATLRDAGIDRAAAVVMLTGNDTTNLEAGLLAHEMNPDVRVVLRMSNSRVSERLEAMIGRGRVRNLQLIDSVEGSAPRCVDLCDGHGGDGAVSAVVDGAGPAASGRRPIVICGLGRLGIGVVRQLKGRVPLVVVDNAQHVHHEDDPAMAGMDPVPLVRGDMTVRRVLEEAGVRHAAAVLVLTPNDTDNLEAAMLVHEMNPAGRIVMRISNSRISRRLDDVLRGAFGASLRVIDPSEYAAPHFVDAITDAYGHADTAAVPRRTPLAPRNVAS
jgi:Trk K+ transport system NAD-binding subunit